MPRSEVEQIEAIVRREVTALVPGTIAVTTGSYRRGKVRGSPALRAARGWALFLCW